VTERHRVAYRLRTAAEGPGGTEQWWTVGKCRQRRVVAQGRILHNFINTIYVRDNCTAHLSSQTITPSPENITAQCTLTKVGELLAKH